MEGVSFKVSLAFSMADSAFLVCLAMNFCCKAEKSSVLSSVSISMRFIGSLEVGDRLTIDLSLVRSWKQREESRTTNLFESQNISVMQEPDSLI